MRLLPESGHELASPGSTGLGVRSGVLQRPAQHDEGGSDQETIPFEVLLAFARVLIHCTCSGDALAIALYDAQKVTGASDEVMRRFQEAVFKEKDKYGMFPKGF